MITPRDWEQVRALFHEALQRPAESRAAFVRQHAENGEVLKEVESLLSAQSEADGFLSSPAIVDIAVDAPRLSPNSRLGPFEILGLLGVGGMGEVYRARDTRLDRAVAIKVLSHDLVASPHGRERFEREARVISKLTHPHVCTLHDVGVAPVAGVDTQFIVMELVEGETLAARLRRGALPIDQAIRTGIEILDALAAAHAAGITHRDLKPGNIMLTKSGVKLLDFGLARFLPSERARETTAGDPLTQEGIIIGTLPYMSPEQLKREESDARSDIFAFGAVFYEMVTGTRAFAANSEAELIAAILERDPAPLTTRQPLAPPALDRIVATCLAKDKEERWPRAREVLRELSWVRDDRVPQRALAPGPTAAIALPKWRWWAAAIAVVIAAMAISFSWRQAAPTTRITFTITPPKGTSFQRASAEMAISPDGSRFVFVAISSDGTRRLWVRRFDAADARVIDGTDDAAYPFWSPDGHSIGFFARGKLVRVDESGGARQELCEARFGRGGTWSRDGTILFGSSLVLARVAASGGEATPVTRLDESRKERVHAFPAFLPDGQRFLYVSLSTASAQSGIYQSRLGSTQTARVLAGATSFALAGGSILSLTNRALTVRTYDPDRIELLDEPLELATGVGLDVRTAHGAFSVAPGALVFRSVGDQSRLTWYEREGRTLGSFPEPGDYQHPWLSPDERRVAVEKTDSTTGRHTIWTLDVVRNVTSRLLVDPRGAHGPVWSPDGTYIVFTSNRLDSVDAYTMRADGTGEASLVIEPTGRPHIPTDWSLDQRLLLYDIERDGNRDIWVQSLSPPRTASPFLATNASEIHARFSPDMRWVAYTSNESGVPEVYVRRFPGGEGAWRVSTHGGAQPQWRRDGRELFYLAADGKLMSTNVSATDSAFETDTPRALFDTGVRGLFVDRRNHYVVTRDGQRFLVNVTDEDDNLAPITVVLNWDSRSRN